VPEDVALVGVDNDDMICETADPPLSSVSVPWERIGYYMAARLDRLMNGRPALRRLPIAGPGPLVVRRSSDVYAVEDEAVVRACCYIRDSISRPIGVEDAARAAAVSRRGLERRFRRTLGRSPLDEIRRVRLDLAKRLLRDTSLTLAAIATRSGFSSSSRFSAVFSIVAGQTPGRYRASFRPG
jgi:LacI family transcriptional regulator